MPYSTSLNAHTFSDPAIWQEVVKSMAEIEKLVWNDERVTDDLTRAEGVRQLTRLIGGALPVTMETVDPEHPQFLQLLSTRVQWGLPSADCHYIWAPLHGRNVYRIVGDRGTAKLFDIEIRNDTFAHLGDWSLHARLGEVEVGPENQVEIFLSRERPAGAVNWVELPEGRCDIILRQYFYDWDKEQMARLTIENQNAIYPPPPLTEETIRKNLELFCDFLQQVPPVFRQSVETYYQHPVNTMAFDAIDYGFRALTYGKGAYQCGEDEALLVEVELPKTQYWNIQLASHFWEARDYHLRQNSLNGHQAQVDSDGVFRAVISHKDPGIANWLDAGGNQTGLMTIRYYEADSTPIPTVTRVPFSDLAKALPADAQTVTTEQRQKTLRNRARAMQRLNRD
tara:strand:- start:5850 stop:7037 length:1188 start_codon:yes stop_codon:yes gene_type:complete